MAAPKKVSSTLGLPPVPLSKLYSFATAGDKAVIVIACICGCASGSILPLFSLIFGSALNTLNDPTANIVAVVSQLS